MESIEVSEDALRALLASLQSERDWRNIQQTVVLSVRRLVAVVVAQQQRLDFVATQLAQLETQHGDPLDKRLKVTRCELASELKETMTQGHLQLTERVCAHVDARLAARRDELERAAKEKQEEMERVHRGEMDALRRQLTNQIQAAATQRAAQALSHVDDVKEEIARKLKRLEKQLHTTEREFTAQWTSWREQVNQSMQLKASHNDVEARLDTQTAKIEELIGMLRDEIHASRSDKSNELDEQNTSQTKLDRELVQVKSHMQELLGIVETLQNEQTVLKALTIDHVQNGTGAADQQASDSKRAMLKLHDAVKSVRKSVESVAKRAELEALSEQVAWIRKQLRSEIYQARYIWKEGRPTAKQTIPWSTQVVNTNSDVFVWQRSTNDAVTTMVPGLYHLQAAFFTSLDPVLQVFINGEPALIITSSMENGGLSTLVSAEKTPSSLHNPATTGASCFKPHGTHRRRLHHSAGDTVGLEICAFLALPARAVITIGYDIDEQAQGFLNIRKL